MRVLVLAGSLVSLTIGGCRARSAAEPAPQETARPPRQEASMPEARPTTNPAPAGQRFTGTLRGGVLAVGAETTGWMLELDDGSRVDVDVSKVANAAAALDGKRVAVQGTMTTTRWIERGAKRLLVAERITAEGEAQ